MPATSAIPTQTVIDDQLITAALWNGEFQNISNLMTPAGIDTYSGTDAQMQLQTNPFPGSVTNHATALAGELERIRYQLALLINGGTDFWYKVPATNMASVGNVVVPIGGIIDFPVATPPNANWHLCDGTALSPVTYATLFTWLSTTFGGNGVTTFNLPDYRDRFSVGAGTTYPIGSVGGEATHVLTTAELPAHNHTAVSTVTDPAHLHTRSMLSVINVDSTGSTRVDTSGSNATDPTSTTNQATTGITVATVVNPSTGGGGAHNNIPPYLSMYKMIRIL